MRFASREWIRQKTLHYGSKLLFRAEEALASRSLVGRDPVFDPRAFPWAKALEDSVATIRDELAPFLRHHARLPNLQDISPDQVRLTHDDGWKTLFLYGFGKRSVSNCMRFPVTTRLVEAVPGMTTACFSILAPGKHVPEHRGPYKGVLRYHLGLVVPRPEASCRMRVGGTMLHWEEGASLVFDDTFPHEAWNDSNELRAVLFLDFRRPLPPVYDWLNRRVIDLVAASPYVGDAMENDARWGAAFDAAVGENGEQESLA